MDAFRVIGGKPLRGEVVISGAKNAALPILMSALLSKTPIVFTNVPQLNDILTTVKLLGQLGAQVQWLADDKLMIDASAINLSAKTKIDKLVEGTDDGSVTDEANIASPPSKASSSFSKLILLQFSFSPITFSPSSLSEYDPVSTLG